MILLVLGMFDNMEDVPKGPNYLRKIEPSPFLYIDLHPQYANGYDSLGEAYMKSGDKKHAIRSYEKSLELNPQNEKAKEMLRKLRGKQAVFPACLIAPRQPSKRARDRPHFHFTDE